MRSRWKAAIIILIMDSIFISSSLAATSQYFRITPKPCTVSKVNGTCMFVWECIKSDGIHLGMCMDGFMFGSCCGHNLPHDVFIPPSTPFLPPNKPTAPPKFEPTKSPSSPSKYGSLTIQRPNGNGFLLIRQPLVSQNPFKTKTTSRRPSSTISSALDNFYDVYDVELTVAASVSASKFLKQNKKRFNKFLFIRFLDKSSMASHYRTQFCNKNKIALGQNNAVASKTKTNKKTDRIRFTFRKWNKKADNF